LLVCFGCCLVGLAVLLVAALGEGMAEVPAGGGGGSPSSGMSGVGSSSQSSSLEGPLTIAGSPTQSEEVRTGEEAKLTNPEAVAERESSRTAYEGLSPEEGAKLAGQKFPAIVDEPVGGPPKLPPGQSLDEFATTNVAQVGLPEGKHELIESLVPMAMEVSPGHLAPLDLTLRSVGNVFEPTTSLMGVKIPRQLNQGVSISNTGISLTPTDAQGAALGGSEGRLDGDAVFFGETGLDTDMIVKPTYDGFDEDALLFSERSATTLSFRVGMPEGASLTQAGASDAVSVIKEGVTLAVIPRPVATGADGAGVPVTMSVAGDMLMLAVGGASIKPDYPVDVDPEVWDEASPAREEGAPERPSNFHSFPESPYPQFTYSETGRGASWRWTEHITENHQKGEYGALAYTTQGDSYIDLVSVYGAWDEPKDHLENLLDIVPPPKKEGEDPEAENRLVLPEESSPDHGYSVEVPKEKGGPRPSSGNSAEYLTESNEKGAGGENVIESAYVRINQETTPEGHFNTTSPTVDGQPNVLYGTSNWLGLKSGAAELIVEDKGIGVSFWSASDNESVSLGGQELIPEDLCHGVQCPEKLTKYLTYRSGLPNGESTLYLYGDNGFGSTESEAESLRTHKVKLMALRRVISLFPVLAVVMKLGKKSMS
jgi:hypothetical protein